MKKVMTTAAWSSSVSGLTGGLHATAGKTSRISVQARGARQFCHDETLVNDSFA